ncbi:MAG: hypothetical protein ACR2RE_14655 [Geminicoccaceae bacterium]
MNYQTALDNVFVTGRIPTGPVGDETEQVGFALIGETIVTVADCGCFRTGLPPATDEAEALWLLRNHPSSRATCI